jgi:hypothetical protein
LQKLQALTQPEDFLDHPRFKNPMRKKLKPIKDRYILPPKKVLNFSNYKSYTDHVNIVPAYQKLDLLDRISPHEKFEILLKQHALNEDSEDDSLLVGPSLVEE